jgi:antirestriction protein ArdC
MTPKPDIYSRITDRIVAQLEAGVRPWQKPWNSEHAAGRITRPLRSHGEPYRGINVLVLWDAAEQAGYSCPIWLTFKQAIDFGGNVKKGEKSTSVVYASTFTKKQEDGTTSKIPFLKQYAVFNAEQCEGLPEKFNEPAQPVNSEIERIERAHVFFAFTGATVEHGGSQAFYRISDDVIRLPRIETFVNAEAYHATQAHEHIHWTRHEKRLNREFGRKRFGDCGYAMEELVAELGSAFLCADTLNTSPAGSKSSRMTNGRFSLQPVTRGTQSSSCMDSSRKPRIQNPLNSSKPRHNPPDSTWNPAGSLSLLFHRHKGRSVMLRIKMAGSLKNCVESDTSRNLHCIRVSKGVNPWVTATTGRIMVSIRSVGENDGDVRLIPAKVFPSVAEIKGQSADKPGCPEVSMNGAPEAKLTLKGESKRIVDVNIDPNEQRYPKVPSVIPEFKSEDVFVVCLNLSFLNAIHEALTSPGSESQGCSLIVPRPADGKTSHLTVGVIGENGIGLIMPLGLDGGEGGDAAKIVKEFNEAAEAFKATF